MATIFYASIKVRIQFEEQKRQSEIKNAALYFLTLAQINITKQITDATLFFEILRIGKLKMK